jgi:hypothetical protein
MTEADLSVTYLRGGNLSGTNLTRTDLSNSSWESTNLSACETMSLAKGLVTIQHMGPSEIDIVTLRACVNDLPDVFLRGVGLTNEEIENLRAMYRKGIAFYSCFISYARNNSDFADRLHTDLQTQNVVCWKDTHDLHAGQKWEEQIGRAIKEHDKLVLICSRQAVYRPNVIKEILT